MRILTLPGVFQPRSDCWMLAAAMREHRLAQGARVLDVFTGSGALAIAAARAGAPSVTAIDLARRAVLTTRLNARLNGVRIHALRGDLFAPVEGERFDLILANPPYVPGDEELPSHGAARAWEGGREGRALLDRLCAQAPRHLAPGGTLLIVQSSLCGEAATLAALARRGLEATTLARHRGPLGPLVRARAELLAARGLLAPGERTEELQAIAGRLPRAAARERHARAEREPSLT